MTSIYSVQPIAGDQVDKAFALAQLVKPSLSPGVWRQFCATAIAAASQNDKPSDSVLVAVNSAEYVQALCIHRVEQVEGIPILSVRSFVAASTLDPSGVREEIIRALISTCRKQDCQEIRIQRECLDTGTVRHLEASGFRIAGEWMRIIVANG